jgi:hypothetical protein
MKSIAQKLQIKPGATLWVSDPAHAALLEPLPDGVRSADGPAAATTAVVFAENAATLGARLAEHSDDLAAPAALWIAYPKGNRADINRDSLWPILREHGLRPVSQVAIDDVWSALRFRALRPGEVFGPRPT